MKKINENKYQIEEQDVIEYLNTLELDDEIDVSCTENWITARIVRKFCDENEIVIEHIYAGYSCVEIRNDHKTLKFMSPPLFHNHYDHGDDSDKYLINWLEYNYGNHHEIYTVEQILSYFNQKK